MKKLTAFSIVLSLLFAFQAKAQSATSLPASGEVLAKMQSAANYFLKEYSDVGADSYVRERYRPSHIWTRSVFYEGLMEVHRVFPDERYLKYAKDWADFHEWTLYRGNTGRNADNQCAAQTYLELYQIYGDPAMMQNPKVCMDMLVNTPQNGDWTWIDAIQMAMPILAQMGSLTGDTRYYEKAYQMYMHTRNVIGGGLWNPKDGLWWRDADFCPPYREPNGEDCYWSRGNGWVFAALVRYMERTPENEAHRKQYEKDFKAMAKALVACQREDGFWNVSLHDPAHFGGKEITGTSLFACGLAWGIRKGLLSEKDYMPALIKAWSAMSESLHADGFLGYIQGTGKEPKDSQPVTYDTNPDFQDFAYGCYLLGLSELYKLCD